MTDLTKVAVIGSGLMGHGIAQMFAVAGHDVAVVDPNEVSLQAVPERIRANLSAMLAHGVQLPDGIDDILQRVRLTTKLADGCQDVGFVTEAVFEDLALKQQIFADLDALCPPEVVLASNTSVMSITEIASKAKHRERIVGTHWWNPPYLIPLVEVVRTEETAVSTAEFTFNLLQQSGKHPVHVYRDVPGFVGNRLQHALWREAFAIIDEGICDAATVDEVVRNSFGLRLPVLAPVENADMVGLDLTLAIHNYILPHINASPTPSTTLQEKVAEEALGFKSGTGFLNWSDEAVAASRLKLTNYLLDVLARQQKEVKMEKLIITAALTGAITVPSQSEFIPYRVEDIAGDAIKCAEAGATAVHIHARNPENGAPSSDPEIVKEIATEIKKGTNAVVGITTGGGMGMSPQDRLRGAAICQPEVASFNLGSINFSMHPVARRFNKLGWQHDWEKEYVEGTKDFIFSNTFGSMEIFAQTMNELNIQPEFEAYDVGHLHNLKFLEQEGLVKPPYWIQFVLGVLGALTAEPQSVMMMKETADRLFGPENYRWSLIGVGYPHEFNMAVMAIIMGGHVRVGLEDNIFVRRRQLARNHELVEKVVRLANELEREIATPDEMRAMLGLKGKDAVNF